MKKAKLITTLALACGVFVSADCLAQTTINAASNSATINGLRFDYSIGEMTLVSTEKTNNLIVTQGFLQPIMIGGRESNPNTNGLNDFASLVKVYPNPTSNQLFIECDELFGKGFDFQLMDVSGKTVLSKSNAISLTEQKFSMNLSALAAGSYFLMMSQQDPQGNMQHTSFKIQKTN